ncbi:MAG TPA: TetR family transcriptional regulator [Streptosporangiaceae bacterium]|nr:TetR family transcriptional regulator [Streptosporangiaceae bacterium]
MTPNPIRRSAADTRAHVLGVARDLFYWQGIHSTGIDKVAAEAKVAATTLYRLFASKDDLVAAYVTSNAEPYKEWMARATRPELGSPRVRILALFDALAEQVQPGQCRGCPFLMTLAEYPDPGHPAHKQAVAVKAWAREHLRQLTRELAAGSAVSDPDALADQLVITMEGVYATVQALGHDGPARQAHALAATLLDAATGPVPADQG